MHWKSWLQRNRKHELPPFGQLACLSCSEKGVLISFQVTYAVAQEYASFERHPRDSLTNNHLLTSTGCLLCYIGGMKVLAEEYISIWRCPKRYWCRHISGVCALNRVQWMKMSDQNITETSPLPANNNVTWLSGASHLSIESYWYVLCAGNKVAINLQNAQLCNS